MLSACSRKFAALCRTVRPSSGSRRAFHRSTATHNSAPEFTFRKQPPMWLWTAVTLGGLGGVLGNFLPWDKSKNEDKDMAKETYLSCLGDEVDQPLPDEEAIITFAPEVPPPITRKYPVRLRVDMNTQVKAVPLDGTHLYEIWGFNGGAPGPFIRARVGDVLDLSFTNEDETGMWHNLDFHSISGPGGGAPVLTCEKNETRTASFRMMYPGLFIYHCAVDPVATHIANGMYGAMLVEPEEGLPPVDKEFYVVQSEFYTEDEADPETHILAINEERLMDENPNYVVFNGSVGSMMESRGGQSLKMNAGERARIFFANAGPNLVSSFHVIGAIFDKVYREGDLISPPARGLQTTLVPAGGCAVVEFVPTTPGNLTLVDHSIVRIEKGAVGWVSVDGPACPRVYHSDKEPRPCKPCVLHP